MLPSYALATVLPVGQSPIRSLSVSRKGGTTTILSCTQQPPFVTKVTVDFETKDLNIQPFNELPISGQVTASVFLGDGVMAVGGLDKEIRILTSDGVQVTTLTGHTGGVISLQRHGKNQLLSGSWDGSWKVWDLETYQCLQTQGGLENGVNVLSHPSGAIIAASTGENSNGKIVNSKLRVYKFDQTTSNYTLSNTLTPHDGPIRSLALPPSPGPDAPVVTVGNDGMVKVNEVFEGLGTMLTLPTTSTGGFLLGVGTNFSVDESGIEKEFVYDIISVSEQGDMYVHNTDVTSDVTSPIQTLPHPTTVWDVAVVPGSGDVVTACHDGKIRIFTRLGDRVADEATMRLHEKDVKENRKKSGKGPSAEEIAKMPDWNLRATIQAKGDKSYQTFRKGDKGIAAQWDAQAGSWIEVGEIVGGAGAKETLDGKEYDHVLPIEIDQQGGGVATLKIGYNVGDNPFVTAQEFIDKYSLDQGYLAQIADYIRQRVGTDNTPTIDMNAHANNGSSTIGDLTGTSMEVDKPPAPVYSHFPPKSMTIFSTGEDKIDKIVTKAKSVLPTLSSSDTSLLDSMCATIKESSRYHASTITEDEFNNIPNNLLPRCPLLDTFPLLDILRLGSLHPSCSKLPLKFFQTVSTTTLANLENSEVDLSTNVPLPMLTFRLFCNLLKVRTLWSTSFWTDEARVKKIVSLGCDIITKSSNKNVKSSVATFALNYCLLPSEISPNYTEILKLLRHIVGKECSTPEDKSNATKGLVAIGTLIALGVTEAKSGDIKVLVRDCSADGPVKGELERAL
eukprot:CAMPEP_0118653282 /NCGR_PEP_ID=MMETSP0785-20121206/11752_1 /TAXON_ID=91992 /ORGANISM="Bolidomonas pacifica, Strain CCMP 1866" /LENGTH=788 /DNA_ID=CAMNT_0006545823 /DNA_START=153 /DNA_END=2515 /DNA_ORIENTATION=-